MAGYSSNGYPLQQYENPMIRKTAVSKPQAGFTLIEVIISAFIFLAVALPMLGRLVNTTGFMQGERALVASWILEQEAASARLVPQKIVPVRQRVVAGKEWVIKAERSGAPLVRVNLSASYKGKTYGQVAIYVFEHSGRTP